MKMPRLSALLLLLAALALAGCGNKHDLFLPPPPDDDEMIDDWDDDDLQETSTPLDDADPEDDSDMDATDGGAAVDTDDLGEVDPALPLPVPTGDD